MQKFVETKDTWKVIKNTINPSSCNNLILHLILNCYMNIENHQISDKNIIAKKFNDYFTNVGFNLAKNIPNIPGDSTQNIHGDYSKSMTVYSTNENEIVNIVHDLKCGDSIL